MNQPFVSIDLREFAAFFEAIEGQEQELTKRLDSSLRDDVKSLLRAGKPLHEVLAMASPGSRTVDQLLDRAWTGLNRNLASWEHSLMEHQELSLSPEESKAAALASKLRLSPPDLLGYRC